MWREPPRLPLRHSVERGRQRRRRGTLLVQQTRALEVMNESFADEGIAIGQFKESLAATLTNL
jgi:hypothetical protein